MRILERVHEVELMVPDELAGAVASRLGVTIGAVVGRFHEHRRSIARGWEGEIGGAALDEALRAPDFRAAAAVLRGIGLDAPSAVIERVLLAAPGPAAARLRVRETARRTGRASLDVAPAA